MELAIDTLRRKRLYRFRSIDHDRLERSSRIFTHHELYFANPTQLNDPWESRPNVTVGDLSNPDYRAKYVDWAFHMMMAGNPAQDPEEVRAWLENQAQQQAEELVLQLRDDYQAAITERYRICSFSNNKEHPLLWSHYAVSHEGFCLEFDASTDIFGGALKVTYQNHYPSIDVTETDEETNLRISVLTKARFWKYEGEYRLVSMEPSEPDALQIDNGIFQYPEHLLTGVIFGCRMSDEDRGLVTEWSAAGAVHVQYKKMVRNTTSFVLNTVDA